MTIKTSPVRQLPAPHFTAQKNPAKTAEKTAAMDQDADDPPAAAVQLIPAAGRSPLGTLMTNTMLRTGRWRKAPESRKSQVTGPQHLSTPGNPELIRFQKEEPAPTTASIPVEADSTPSDAQHASPVSITVQDVRVEKEESSGSPEAIDAGHFKKRISRWRKAPDDCRSTVSGPQHLLTPGHPELIRFHEEKPALAVAAPPVAAAASSTTTTEGPVFGESEAQNGIPAPIHDDEAAGQKEESSISPAVVGAEHVEKPEGLEPVQILKKKHESAEDNIPEECDVIAPVAEERAFGPAKALPPRGCNWKKIPRARRSQVHGPPHLELPGGPELVHVQKSKSVPTEEVIQEATLPTKAADVENAAEIDVSANIYPERLASLDGRERHEEPFTTFPIRRQVANKIPRGSSWWKVLAAGRARVLGPEHLEKPNQPVLIQLQENKWVPAEQVIAGADSKPTSMEELKFFRSAGLTGVVPVRRNATDERVENEEESRMSDEIVPYQAGVYPHHPVGEPDEYMTYVPRAHRETHSQRRAARIAAVKLLPSCAYRKALITRM